MRFVSLIIAILFLFTSKSMAHDNCGASRDVIVDAAVAGVLKLMPFAKKEAKDAVSKTTSFTTWFGSYDKARETFVQKQLAGAEVLLTLGKAKFRCGTSVDKNCVEGMSAYVDVAVSRTDVTFCDAFFSEDKHFQRGAILHELVHLLISNPGDPHPELSASEAKQLAIDKPGEAIKSAYNYQFWFQ
jgi:hypothetical protein